MSQFNKYLEIVQEGKDYSYNEIFGSKTKKLSIEQKIARLIEYEINTLTNIDNKPQGYLASANLEKHLSKGDNYKKVTKSNWTSDLKVMDFLQKEGVISSFKISELKKVYDDISEKYKNLFEYDAIIPGDSKEKYDRGEAILDDDPEDKSKYKMTQYKKGAGVKFSVGINFVKLNDFLPTLIEKTGSDLTYQKYLKDLQLFLKNY